jgi:hypothetical protein
MIDSSCEHNVSEIVSMKGRSTVESKSLCISYGANQPITEQHFAEVGDAMYHWGLRPPE